MIAPTCGCRRSRLRNNAAKRGRRSEAALLRISLRASGRAARALAARLQSLWKWLWARRLFRRLLAAAVSLALILLVAYTVLVLTTAADLVRIERRPPALNPQSVGLHFEEVRFRSRDGLLLTGWLMEPEIDQEQRRLVIIVQDAGGSRGDPAQLQLAAALVDAGFAVLSFDSRGAGESQGERFTLGYGERHDLSGAVTFGESRGYAGPSIGVLGLGTGGATALLTAAETTRMAALVVDSSYASLPDHIRASLRDRHLPQALLWGIAHAVRLLYGPDISHILPEEAVARMTPRPLLVIHGEKDQVVSADHARRLVEAAGPDGAELWLVPQAGHLEALSLEQQRYIDRVITFFEQTLGKNHE